MKKIDSEIPGDGVPLPCSRRGWGGHGGQALGGFRIHHPTQRWRPLSGAGGGEAWDLPRALSSWPGQSGARAADLAVF